MKRVILLCCFILAPTHAALATGKFLGVPVAPEGKTVLKSERRLVVTTPLSHDKVLKFYEKAFADEEDVKIRDWEDETYIEDDSNRPWHSVTISKVQDQEGTRITIAKDSWTWIMGTLILRYVGVFVVLLSLFIGFTVTGKVLSTLFRAEDA